MTDIDIGISKENRMKIAEGLKRLLADSYTLYLQTHNFHWNVTGLQFRELHLMFEEHYTELGTQGVWSCFLTILNLGNIRDRSCNDTIRLDCKT